MAAQRGAKRRKVAEKPDKEINVAPEKAKVVDKKALIRPKVKERVRLKSDEPLAITQKALRAAQAKVKHERQARIQAEKALTEAQEALAAAQLEAEQVRQSRVRRVSFVVRLTVDAHGQLGRTEIEHVESSRKQNFPSPHGEGLVAFMEACISPAIIPEHAISAAPLPEKVTAPTLGPVRPKSTLIVSDVRVLRPGDADFMTLTLTPEEPFVVQARFQLQGPEARPLTAQESSYGVKVYANELTSGKSQLLATYSAKLIEDVLEYIAPAEAPGLSPGLYRVFTVITLSGPIKMAGFYGKTIIRVT